MTMTTMMMIMIEKEKEWKQVSSGNQQVLATLHLKQESKGNEEFFIEPQILLNKPYWIKTFSSLQATSD